MTIYHMLNTDAKNWWYHLQLRNWGRIEEARQRERASIRSHLRTLRHLLEQQGTITEMGDGTFHTSQLRDSATSTYHSEFANWRSGQGMLEAALHLGIPVTFRKGAR